MRAFDLAAFAGNYKGETEIGIEIVFPELENWSVISGSYIAMFDSTERMPLLRVEIYGSDFDYPKPHTKLLEFARQLIANERDCNRNDPEWKKD